MRQPLHRVSTEDSSVMPRVPVTQELTLTQHLLKGVAANGVFVSLPNNRVP